MGKKVFVSSAQKSAAEAMVRRSAITGRKVSRSVRKIAAAKVEQISTPAARIPTSRGPRPTASKG